MGTLKHQTDFENDDREKRWNYAAMKNNFFCVRCGEVPPYCEREFFFETRICTYCAALSKDD
jgi:hypothetical protein